MGNNYNILQVSGIAQNAPDAIFFVDYITDVTKVLGQKSVSFIQILNFVSNKVKDHQVDNFLT